MSGNNSSEIDEGLYSRQLYVLGVEAMKRMGASNVLIVGLKGLGCEIAKNVVLAGVKSVTLYDPSPVEISDLSSQFFLHQEDIGQPRAQVSAPRLAELNQYVPVSVLDKEMTPEVIASYKCVVVTDIPQQQKLEISEAARKNNVCFISTELRGLFGYTFNDFGSEFVVIDATGEEPLSGMVANIEQSADGVVTCLDETRHGLEDGQLVTFSEVQGMTELNGCEPRKVTVLGPYTFSIGDTTGLSEYKRGGLFKQVKVPVTQNFKSFKEALESPEFFISDFAKFDRPGQLHVGFQALHQFAAANGGKMPRPGNDADAKEVIRLAHAINDAWSQKTELDDKLLQQLASQATGDLSPMVAVFGGLVAQEVLKACTGKFSPINNFMYFDALECLPVGFAPSEADLAPTGSRYDGQIAVFGRSFQNKLANFREFLVGSGAIGCEMLKNWAMMGLGSGAQGVIHVTDMDTIEKSNLNRQFLFRPADVGQLKSDTAARAVVKMNPELQGKIVTHQDRMGADTEAVYNDDFFESLDGVTNALDNVDARRYMDSRCVYYRKPLLESGTLGTKGNTQVVIPHLTESYGASRDPQEKQIPICTLKNFPNAIEHTIQWARDLFEGLFVQPAESVNAYLSTPDYMEKTFATVGDSVKIETLQKIRDFLVTDKPLAFGDCVAWARRVFEELYNNAIQQLLFNFPKDSVTASGQPFWSPPKRAPDAVAFDPKNEQHVAFIVAAANLHAFNYGLKGSRDREQIRRMAMAVQVPAFKPKEGVKIQVNENEENASISADEGQLAQLMASLPDPSAFAGVRLEPADFEKDDDSNFHIDFITAASNLRAANYGITIADRFRTKQIAGKIIPAIATTTSLVTGLVCLELYKIVGSASADGQTQRKLEDYKNGFINLALPFFGFSEPIPPARTECNGKEYTQWDTFDYGHNLTLGELMADFKKQHKLEITMISSGTSMLYASFYAKKKAEERRAMKASEAIEAVTKEAIPAHVKWVTLEACCEDEDEEDVEVPSIRVKIRD
ncbi:E1 ubiquitin-activating protein [Coemansia sp. RSA 989]|nr:ubiquitin-activating emzyme E1 [Coemansia mojavensis]KAJ1740866.1 E1 ubiquitin-activating protein [Coemansia sp. RSA 1086]KAJ1749202.1 E1 ubiquitin-activating protein [Coemansia sp. RSA 1821]KAJ1865907.1 E1 ubiquitin-activating protein [Coemansia sp. RSA 989]KAJ1873052.1 E1 ubiquitin-activating protein [Coemansia sp. RSA 990]KAJ2673351.1 E1 ubiquitin-activating protein [Coemansia sp. RSA 1085]